MLTLHRHQEWLRFLKTIDRHTPKTKQLHLIVDNYATPKHPEVIAGLVKHPRFHMHFTPTSSSWLNMVERFLRDITDKRIRRGVFTSVAEFEAATFVLSGPGDHRQASSRGGSPRHGRRLKAGHNPVHVREAFILGSAFRLALA